VLTGFGIHPGFEISAKNKWFLPYVTNLAEPISSVKSKFRAAHPARVEQEDFADRGSLAVSA